MNIPHLTIARRTALTAAVATVVLAGASYGAYAVIDSTTSSGADSTTSGANNNAGDSSAVVVNHNDDSYRYAISFKIRHVSGDYVDPTNVAAAVASCTNCETIAISLEGVLVYGDPSVYAPTNLALAYNVNCNNCQTLAAAYQEIAQYSDHMHITKEGRQKVNAIRADLHAIRQDQSLTLAEIDARVNADAAVLLDVLQHDVVAAGKPADAPGAGPAAATPTASASASASGSSSPVTPSSTATPSATPSPTPSNSQSG